MGTGKGFLASMSSHVSFQLCYNGETLGALITTKSFSLLSTVRYQMILQGF
jgi:hypothetical protein